ncbi:MAG TPA: hypothetical protein VFP93_02510, partial [Gammaproteobacteria bacterium]|nr:hypothetical protein [Gammaproteobacteria bacterium]
RKRELNLNIPAIAQLLKKVEQGCILCYKNILQLQSLLQNRTYKDLNHHEVINQVHSLETETKSLTQCMVALNEMALKRDPLYQLFEAELFKTLMHLESSDKLPASHLAQYYERGSGLRDKAHRIKDAEKRKIAFNLISYYETLKRASNLSQNDASLQSIEMFKQHAELFFGASANADTENQGKELIVLLFNDLEAMRFLNRTGIFEKSSAIRKQFKQLLQQSLFGKECLKELQMSPRSKMLLRTKF